MSLDGTIKSILGMLPAIIVARKEGFKIVYLPIDQIDGMFFFTVICFFRAPRSSEVTADVIPSYEKTSNMFLDINKPNVL